MRNMIRLLVSMTFAALTLGPIAVPCVAQTSTAPIQAIKLLAPQTGWASAGGKLFWTTTAGAQWKDITPKKSHVYQAITSVFFLDSTRGWILQKCADRHDDTFDDTCYELASTINAGASWSMSRIKVSDPDPESGFSDHGWLNFADPLHGWIILKVNRSTAVSFGVLIRTEDGGKTWTQLDEPPIAGRFHFTTATTGWMAGGPDHALYVTRDGGKSWQIGTLPDPKQIGEIYSTDYDLPTFENDSHGALPVRYDVGAMGGKQASTVVLFVTTDAGKSWSLGKTLAGLPQNYGTGMPYPSAVVSNGTLRAGFLNAEKQFCLQTLGLNGSSEKRTCKFIPRFSALEELSFVDLNQGWALANGGLLSTSDGGVSWQEITPVAAQPAQTPHHSAVQPRSSPETVSSPVGSALTLPSPDLVLGGHTSARLGFDKSFHICNERMTEA